MVHTCPRADRDLFIAAASTSRCPLASVLLMRSEPAKSQSVSTPLEIAPLTLSVPDTVIRNNKCDRELGAKRIRYVRS